MFERRPSAPALGLVAAGVVAALLLHLALGASTGFSVDEAHYALYAVHLDWSYFDHPPMVGWLQWPVVTLGGGPGWIRLIPQAIWLATLWQAGEAAADLAAGDAAEAIQAARRWTWLVLLAAPLLHVLALGLLPDTPLMLLAVLTLRVTARLTRDDRAGMGAWAALGLCLGLAGMSKYTAVTLVPVVAWALVAARGAAVLRERGAWLALALAALGIAPVIGWNATHDWISLRYQLGHGAGGQAWHPGRIAAFVVVQVLVYGPLLTLLPWGRAAGRAGRLALGAGLLPLLLLAVLAGRSSSLPHWTAYAWVMLAPRAGLALAQGGRRLHRVARVLLALQGLLVAALFGLLWWGGVPAPLLGLLPPAQAAHLAASNPVADVYGWDRAGAEAARLAAQQGVTRLAVQNWTLASRLAWYARPLPVEVLEPRFDQFTLWFGELPPGASAIVVDWSGMAYRLPVGAGEFATCRGLGSLPIERHGMTLSRFAFYRCDGWGGRPAPQRSAP